VWCERGDGKRAYQMRSKHQCLELKQADTLYE
jgi:hypothetical protein